MRTKFTKIINACLKASMTPEDINAVVDNRIALSYAIDEAVKMYGDHSDDCEMYIGQLKDEYYHTEDSIWAKYGVGGEE